MSYLGDFFLERIHLVYQKIKNLFLIYRLVLAIKCSKNAVFKIVLSKMQQEMSFLKVNAKSMHLVYLYISPEKNTKAISGWPGYLSSPLFSTE
jgi:hypothetical protein